MDGDRMESELPSNPKRDLDAFLGVARVDILDRLLGERRGGIHVDVQLAAALGPEGVIPGGPSTKEVTRFAEERREEAEARMPC